MVEAVQGYPRWQGELSRAPRFLVIALEELKKVYRDRWTFPVFAMALLLAALAFATTSAFQRSQLDALLAAMRFVEWGALAIAAISAGPALLEDKRQGALELYLSRAVRPWEHFAGKALAVWTATFLVTAAPMLLYYVSSLFTLDEVPANWRWVWLGLLGRAFIWSTVVSGLGLGLSAVLRSGRAATLVLFGAIASLDIVLSELLSLLSRDDVFQVVSPLANLQQQSEWLFPGGTAPHGFPWWWGLLALLGLALVGWAVAWLRRPRLRGVE